MSLPQAQVGTRILAVLLSIVFLSSCAFLVTLISLRDAREAQREITEHALPLLQVSHGFSQELSQYLLLLEKMSSVGSQWSTQIASNMIEELEASQQEIKRELQELRKVEGEVRGVTQIETIFQEITEAADELSHLALRELPSTQASAQQQLKAIELTLRDIRRQAKVFVVTTKASSKTTNAIVAIREHMRTLDEILGYYLHHPEVQQLRLLKTRYVSAIEGATHQLSRIEDATLRKTLAANIAALFAQGVNSSGFFQSALLLDEGKRRMAVLLERSRQKEQQIDVEVSQFLNGVKVQTNQGLEEFDSSIKSNVVIVSLAMILSTVLSLLIVFVYIYPRVSKRLSQLAQNTNKVASGEYSFDIDIEGNDEISRMARALDGFRWALLAKERSDLERAKEEKVIGEVYRIATDSSLSFEQKLSSLLELGGAHYGLASGSVHQVRDGKSEAFYLWSKDGPVNSEVVATMGDYGLRIFSKSDVAAWQGFDSDDVKGEHLTKSIASYIGIVLVVDGALFGTLCFFDVTTRATPFTDRETSFIGVIAQGVANEISSKARLKEKDRLIGELSDSNEELERFAYVCSHDLQEPLRMIQSFSQKLQSHLQGQFENDEKGARYFRFIVDGASRAQNLIADILNYSSLDRDGTQFGPVSMSKLVARIKQDLGAFGEETEHHVTYDPLPTVLGNQTQLYQLLQNLVSNGLKYHAKDGRPKVHVGVEAFKDHWVFSVRDNGIGIEKRHQEKIFEVFQRLHGRAQYTGTGVGLSICKKVVRRHGGEIWVKSDKDEGSTFYFTIMKSGTHEEVLHDSFSIG